MKALMCNAYGPIDTLKVEPHYKGDSIVPSRITMTGTHGSGGGHIRTMIAVW